MARRKNNVRFTGTILFPKITVPTLDTNPMHDRTGGQYNCRVLVDMGTKGFLIASGFPTDFKGSAIFKAEANYQFSVKLQRPARHKIPAWGGPPKILDYRRVDRGMDPGFIKTGQELPWRSSTPIPNGSLCTFLVNLWRTPEGTCVVRLEEVGIVELHTAARKQYA